MHLLLVTTSIGFDVNTRSRSSAVTEKTARQLHIWLYLTHCPEC